MKYKSFITLNYLKYENIPYKYENISFDLFFLHIFVEIRVNRSAGVRDVS